MLTNLLLFLVYRGVTLGFHHTTMLQHPHAVYSGLAWGGPLCFESHEVVFAHLKPDLERLLAEGTILL